MQLAPQAASLVRLWEREAVNIVAFDPRITYTGADQLHEMNVLNKQAANRMLEFAAEQNAQRQKENRDRAREFKANQEIAEVAFGLPKDVSLTMGADRLKGFVAGKTVEQTLQQQALQNLARYASAMRDAQEIRGSDAMAGFAGDLGKQLHPQLSPQFEDYYENPEKHKERPAVDVMGAYAGALSRHPEAAMSGKLRDVTGSIDQLRSHATEVIEVDGQKYLRNLSTGGLHPVPRNFSGNTPVLPLVDETGKVLGYGIPNSRGGITQLRSSEGKRHPLQLTLDRAEAELAAARVSAKYKVPSLEAKVAALKRKIAEDQGQAVAPSTPSTNTLRYDPATKTFR